MNKENQQYLVLGYMIAKGGITNREAVIDLGVGRLSARIWDLRKKGHQIETDWVFEKNRRGEMTRFAKYRLAETA